MYVLYKLHYTLEILDINYLSIESKLTNRRIKKDFLLFCKKFACFDFP